MTDDVKDQIVARALAYKAAFESRDKYAITRTRLLLFMALEGNVRGLPPELLPAEPEVILGR